MTKNLIATLASLLLLSAAFAQVNSVGGTNDSTNDGANSAWLEVPVNTTEELPEDLGYISFRTNVASFTLDADQLVPGSYDLVIPVTNTGLRAIDQLAVSIVDLRVDGQTVGSFDFNAVNFPGGGTQTLGTLAVGSDTTITVTLNIGNNIHIYAGQTLSFVIRVVGTAW